jgi:hypothetical protein
MPVWDNGANDRLLNNYFDAGTVGTYNNPG